MLTLPRQNRRKALVLDLLGVACGGILGGLLYYWSLRYGYLLVFLPGILAALGCALTSEKPSRIRGAACSLLAMFLALFLEWQFAPFRVNESYWYFLANVHELSRQTIFGVLVAGALAFIFGSRSIRAAKQAIRMKSG
jgi:hypothetical protein